MWCWYHHRTIRSFFANVISVFEFDWSVLIHFEHSQPASKSPEVSLDLDWTSIESIVSKSQAFAICIYQSICILVYTSTTWFAWSYMCALVCCAGMIRYLESLCTNTILIQVTLKSSVKSHAPIVHLLVAGTHPRKISHCCGIACWCCCCSWCCCCIVVWWCIAMWFTGACNCTPDTFSHQCLKCSEVCCLGTVQKTGHRFRLRGGRILWRAVRILFSSGHILRLIRFIMFSFHFDKFCGCKGIMRSRGLRRGIWASHIQLGHGMCKACICCWRLSRGRKGCSTWRHRFGHVRCQCWNGLNICICVGCWWCCWLLCCWLLCCSCFAFLAFAEFLYCLGLARFFDWFLSFLPWLCLANLLSLFACLCSCCLLNWCWCVQSSWCHKLCTQDLLRLDPSGQSWCCWHPTNPFFWCLHSLSLIL